MTTTTHNEAAERLAEALLDTAFNDYDAALTYAMKALATERRATVERIKKRLPLTWWADIDIAARDEEAAQ